jgi:hypothetical protein
MFLRGAGPIMSEPGSHEKGPASPLASFVVDRARARALAGEVPNKPVFVAAGDRLCFDGIAGPMLVRSKPEMDFARDHLCTGRFCDSPRSAR